MNHKSLLDSESDTPDDRDYSAERKRVNMEDLITTAAVIKSNYATKTDIANLNGKLDTFQQATKADFAVANGKLEAFQQAAKADLNDAIYQLTWRMAGFAVTIVAAVAALVRYL
jgi:hypothetical protein